REEDDRNVVAVLVEELPAHLVAAHLGEVHLDEGQQRRGLAGDLERLTSGLNLAGLVADALQGPRDSPTGPSTAVGDDYLTRCAQCVRPSNYRAKASRAAESGCSRFTTKVQLPVGRSYGPLPESPQAENTAIAACSAGLNGPRFVHKRLWTSPLLHGGKAGLAKGGMRVAHQRWGESPT